MVGIAGFLEATRAHAAEAWAGSAAEGWSNLTDPPGAPYRLPANPKLGEVRAHTTLAQPLESTEYATVSQLAEAVPLVGNSYNFIEVLYNFGKTSPIEYALWGIASRAIATELHRTTKAWAAAVVEALTSAWGCGTWFHAQPSALPLRLTLRDAEHPNGGRGRARTRSV